MSYNLGSQQRRSSPRKGKLQRSSRCPWEGSNSPLRTMVTFRHSSQHCLTLDSSPQGPLLNGNLRQSTVHELIFPPSSSDPGAHFCAISLPSTCAQPLWPTSRQPSQLSNHCCQWQETKLLPQTTRAPNSTRWPWFLTDLKPKKKTSPLNGVMTGAKKRSCHTILPKTKANQHKNTCEGIVLLKNYLFR